MRDTSSVPATPSAPPRVAYQVRTPRLLLRGHEAADIARRLEAVESSGEYLREFFPPPTDGTPPLETHVAQVRKFRGHFDLDQDRTYAVVDPDTGRFLGEVGLYTRAGIGAREVGYWVRRDAAGKGLATEMASAVIRTAFELDGLKRIDLTCDPANLASAAVARRMGFTLEGRLRDRQLAPHHRRGDIFYFTLLSTEYPGSPVHAVPIEAYDVLGRRLL
ncbi:GNAT family protein [Myxococcaceae bacterium GXIMD 01537]